jgi:hypothetical protein
MKKAFNKKKKEVSEIEVDENTEIEELKARSTAEAPAKGSQLKR